MTQLKHGSATPIQAETLLTSLSRMLDGGSEDAVAALVSVLPIDQTDGGLAAFRNEADRIAEAHDLEVEVSANGTHMRVRFSRQPRV